jgi:hypothetical protein
MGFSDRCKLDGTFQRGIHMLAMRDLGPTLMGLS